MQVVGSRAVGCSFLCFRHFGAVRARPEMPRSASASLMGLVARVVALQCLASDLAGVVTETKTGLELFPP